MDIFWEVVKYSMGGFGVILFLRYLFEIIIGDKVGSEHRDIFSKLRGIDTKLHLLNNEVRSLFKSRAYNTDYIISEIIKIKAVEMEAYVKQVAEIKSRVNSKAELKKQIHNTGKE